MLTFHHEMTWMVGYPRNAPIIRAEQLRKVDAFKHDLKWFIKACWQTIYLMSVLHEKKKNELKP